VKSREGFVSNSSSSSFLVSFKGVITEENLTRALSLEPWHPLYNTYLLLWRDIICDASYIANNPEELSTWITDFYSSQEERGAQRLLELMKEGHSLMKVRVSWDNEEGCVFNAQFEMIPNVIGKLSIEEL
jgi:hypothetical protein